MSVGGALISVALTIAALTSVVNSTDFSGTEHHRTDISEFRAPTLVALPVENGHTSSCSHVPFSYTGLCVRTHGSM